MFHNPVRKHARNGMLSPIEFIVTLKAVTQSDGKSQIAW
jgi:hypothetical protein